MSAATKHRILLALRDLTLASGIDVVSVRDIVARAGVARSSFYENFDDKADGFRAILEPVLVPFADACTTDGDRRRLIATLTHMQETASARNMLGQTRRAIVASLIELIEARLRRRLHGRGTDSLPLIAAGIAEAQVGIITAWLDAQKPVPVELVADLIVSAARSCAQNALSDT